MPSNHRPRFACLLSIAALLVHLAGAPARAEIPAPEKVLGFAPGTDSKLADWDQVQRYFQALAGASDRVAVERIGTTSLGRPMILVIVSGSKNVQARKKISAMLHSLSDPRTTPKAQARKLIEKAPVAVFVGCAQHSNEIASTQMSMRLAYELAAAETQQARTIRENVVLLLVPSLNPDGHQMICDWYRKHRGTPFEGSRMPWLYHKYVGHDINRDWAMLTQSETRSVARVLFHRWFPQIVIDVHQMGNSSARMFLPPYYDPINPNMDPLLQHELTLLSAQMRLDMSIAGHKGIVTNALFDEWLLGYLTSVPARHNMVSQLIEMASVNVASPIFQRRSQLKGPGGALRYSRRANFPEPWQGGWWRLGDIVAYEKTAISSALALAARSRRIFLENFYRLGTKQVDAGRREPPFAFLVPADQKDRATAWEMLAALMRGGVEVEQAREPFEADRVKYPAGTWVVPMAQPFRAHAKDLLERQVYPDLRSASESAPQRPYDVTGWTYPLLMGVECVKVIHPFDAKLQKVPAAKGPPRGRIAGKGDFLCISRRQAGAYVVVNRLLAAGERVQSLAQETSVTGATLPAGAFVVEARGDLRARLERWAGELGLSASWSESAPCGKMLEVRRVRLGLYQPWTGSMDEGWTRWVLERFEFPFATVHDAEIRAGRLGSRYDAIVLPDLSARSIVEGVREGDLPPEYTGGIGEEGVFALRDFVRKGGRLIALDSSSDLLIEKLELPVRNVQKTGDPDGKPVKPVACPGSILSLNVRNDHPLAFGLDPVTAILFAGSPVFDLSPEPGGKENTEKEKGKDAENEKNPRASPDAVMVGTYPRVNPLLSGWIENDAALHGKGALVEATFGEGTAVLIGFRCQFRAQTHGTFAVLFNAILGSCQSPAGDGNGRRRTETF